MDELITMVERGTEDKQAIATIVARPSCGSKATGNVSNAPSVAAAMLSDLVGIVIPLAK
jgi:hypothetical protein